jgi:RNA polymerase subunit RPABC4/transcription elongation factor Spt4
MPVNKAEGSPAQHRQAMKAAQKKLDELYKALGVRTYSCMKDNDFGMPELALIKNEIEDTLRVLDSSNSELQHIKAMKQVSKGAPCPQCGMKTPPGSVVCPYCGMKIIAQAAPVPGSVSADATSVLSPEPAGVASPSAVTPEPLDVVPPPAAVSETVEMIVCLHCGGEITADAVFCGLCGQEVVEQITGFNSESPVQEVEREQEVAMAAKDDDVPFEQAKDAAVEAVLKVPVEPVRVAPAGPGPALPVEPPVRVEEEKSPAEPLVPKPPEPVEMAAAIPQTPVAPLEEALQPVAPGVALISDQEVEVVSVSTDDLATSEIPISTEPRRSHSDTSLRDVHSDTSLRNAPRPAAAPEAAPAAPVGPAEKACTKCGEVQRPEAAFCFNCGARL